VLILAPARGEGDLTAQLLARHGHESVVCDDVDQVAAEMERGVAAVLVDAEALDPGLVEALEAHLAGQPFWSDLPLLVLTRHDEGQGPDPIVELLGPESNVTLLERPVPLESLTSAVRAAVRARTRQYEVRDLVRRMGELDRRKDEFLAMLSHELRNPLAAIRSSLAVLQGLDDRPQARKPQDVIDRQTRHLAHLLEDLLDTARIQEGKITLTPTRVDLGRQIGEALLSLSDSHRQRVRVQSPREPVEVEGDPVRLDQVFSNLLHNALKYSPADSPVTVRLAAEDGDAVLTVEDEGVGIEAEMLPRIFEPFTQVEASLARSEGGLGLGLPLVRNLVELHGGEVTVESPGPGLGSAFRVRLPLAPPAPRGEATEPEPAETPSRDLTTILVVEDGEDNRLALVALLELWGYEPVEAATGAEALDKAAEHRPELALVDIGLPGMDGYEVARKLRETFSPAELYLVALTGYGQAEDRELARKAGFDLHLVKPVPPGRLQALLEEL
jgi:signal transduction histidine kinase/CheY-like chemotaxis protein